MIEIPAPESYSIDAKSREVAGESRRLQTEILAEGKRNPPFLSKIKQNDEVLVYYLTAKVKDTQFNISNFVHLKNQRKLGQYNNNIIE